MGKDPFYCQSHLPNMRINYQGLDEEKLILDWQSNGGLHRFALGTYFYLLENECKEEGDQDCVDSDTVSRLGWLPLASFRKSEHLCKMINLNLPRLRQWCSYLCSVSGSGPCPGSSTVKYTRRRARESTFCKLASETKGKIITLIVPGRRQ